MLLYIAFDVVIHPLGGNCAWVVPELCTEGDILGAGKLLVKSITLDTGGCKLSDDGMTRGSVNCTTEAVPAGNVPAMVFAVAVV